MPDLTNHPELRRVAATTRVIVIALASAQAVFLAIAAAIREPRTEPIGTGIANLTHIAVAVAAMFLLARTVIPRLITQAVLSRIPPRSQPSQTADSLLLTALLRLWQARAIISAALAEAAGFLCAVAHFLEGSLLSLMAGAFLVAATLVPFPSASGAAHWVEDNRADFAAGGHSH